MNSQKWIWWVVWVTVIVGSKSMVQGQDVCLRSFFLGRNTSVMPSSQLKVSHHCEYLRPRRIVVVTAKNREDRLDEQDHFARALARSLMSSPGGFSVVVSQEKLCENELPMRRGYFNEQELVALNHKYQADAVLYCDLRRLVSFAPMSVEGSLVMVHIDQAVALVGLQEVYDLRTPATRRSYDGFSVAGQCKDSFGCTHLQSPAQLIEFVAHQSVQQLLKAWSF